MCVCVCVRVHSTLSCPFLIFPHTPFSRVQVLDPEVRAVLCPDKISHETWLEVVETAHSVGLPTTSTLMFGHLEHGPATWARHLTQLRDLQERSLLRAAAAREAGGPAAAAACITEFVPLPFVHMEAPVYLKGASRRGPTLRECTLLHAVARLALFPAITNIQASWVKMGPGKSAGLLAAGCNDMGGVLMNESITRAAGAAHGQQLGAAEMEGIIRAAGRVPRQRTTLYGRPPACQVSRSLEASSSLGLEDLVFASPRGKLS